MRTWQELSPLVEKAPVSSHSLTVQGFHGWILHFPKDRKVPNYFQRLGDVKSDKDLF